MSVYKNVNGQIIVARLYNSFKIDYTDWEARSAQWINEALGKLHLYSGTTPCREQGNVANYRAKLPCDLKLLRGIEYDTYRLPRIYNAINDTFAADVALQDHPTEKYELTNDDWITTTFEEDTIYFHYRKLPVEQCPKTKIWYPLIPDDENVFTAIEWYVLYRMILRGYNIPSLSLDNRNEYTNPALAWDKYMKIARNSVSKPDADEREMISRHIRTFLSNYNAYYDEFYVRKTE